ncbi:bacteriohemerythrin [Clostridium thailandense]|uniref:Hemerythrin family protein n=1 Tax=Clostridium thailandense TaxID=2794346 RepID=A0A949WTB2_9CLOT|nr:hemerythrin family protein [Clostridium thailandense]MBV7276125.1 hemerythrin family protein [Clostridium thailandense]
MFDWKKEYSINIKIVDDEHRKLFEIGQSIYDLAINKNYVDYYDRILDLIDELKEYTVYHFSDEERVMRLYDYPDFDNHKKIHEEFVGKIENVNLNTVDDDQQKSILRLMDFVYVWIDEHILGQDLKIKDYFNQLKNNVDFTK